MQTFGISNVYIVVGLGFTIWMIGQSCGGIKGRKNRPSKLGKFLSLVGFLVFAVGMYAGFKGPLTISGVTLETFPFSKKMEQSSADALTYARNSLDIDREPAVGWHGASKSSLQYTVKNNGDKQIERMTVRFSTTGGSSIDLPLHGPFPAKKTVSSVVNVPSNVNRSYFNRAKAAAGEIVSAQF